MSPVDEDVKKYIDSWGHDLSRHLETRITEFAVEMPRQITKHIDGLMSNMSRMSDRMTGTLEEIAEFRGETKAALGALDRTVNTMSKNIDGVISRQQRQGSAIGAMQANCESRHDHDTDEHNTVTALRNQVDQLQTAHEKVEQKLQNGDAKFNELENTDVRMRVVEETKKQEQELRWKRLVQAAAILGSLGAGTIATLVVQALIK